MDLGSKHSAEKCCKSSFVSSNAHNFIQVVLGGDARRWSSSEFFIWKTVQARVIVLFAAFIIANIDPNVCATSTDEDSTSALVSGRVFSLKVGALSNQSDNDTGASSQRDQLQFELLAIRHNRRDPLSRFNLYRGGYNLQSKHYLASTLFTGIPGYILGTIWLLIGAFGAIISFLKCRRSQKKAAKGRRTVRLSAPLFQRCGKRKFLPAISAATLIGLIIPCGAIACVGSHKFYIQAKKLERTLIQEGANNATSMIDSVTKVMRSMELDIEKYDEGVAQRLDNTTEKLHKASANLLRTMGSQKRNLDSVLSGLNIGVFAIAITNCFLWALGSVCYLISSRFRQLLLVIFAMLWILTALSWFGFGLTYAISNFSSDTCEALQEYQDSSSSKNTTLDNVLPCRSLAAGGKLILRLREGIFEFIEYQNTRISNFTGSQGQVKILKEKFNGFPVQDLQLCNPFLGPPTYESRSRNCNTTTISISSWPMLLSMFKCEYQNKTNKTQAMCIPQHQYEVALAYINIIEKFLDMLPEVQRLTNCSFVVNAFSILLNEHCGPLQHSIQMVWLALVLLSTLSTLAILLSILQFWIVSIYSHYSFAQWGGIVTPT